jgi:hypothetical protein
MLQDDAGAFEQLQAAAELYAEESGEEVPDTGEPADDAEIVVEDLDTYDDFWYLTYGFYWVGGRWVVGDLPGCDFIEWLLDHCDKFPDLADRIIEHVRDRLENGERIRFPGEMGDALARWQERHPITGMQGLLNRDGLRRERLQEFGQLLRESGHIDGADAGTMARQIAENADRFPNLARPGGQELPVDDARRAPVIERGDRVTPTPRRNIDRITPTSRQRMQRAVTRHRSAWRPRYPVRRPTPRGGRAPRGGFRR